MFRDIEKAIFSPKKKGHGGKLYSSLASAEKALGKLFSQGWYEASIVDAGSGKFRVIKKRKNPASTSGYVKCKAVKIVRDKKGRAISVKIKT